MQKRKKIRSKKRKHRSSPALMYFLGGVFLIALLIVLSLTVFFPVEKITVRGASVYTVSEITANCGIETGDNLFRADTGSVSEKLSARLPYIKSAAVKRKLPSEIQITVESETVYAQIEQSGKYVYLTSSGKCLELADTVYNGAIIIRGAKVQNADPGSLLAFASDEDIDASTVIAQLINEINANEIDNITVISISDPQNIFVTYDNKIVLKLGTTSNLDKKFAHAAATIEVRTDNRDTGILDLSAISASHMSASFVPSALNSEQIAVYNEKN